VQELHVGESGLRFTKVGLGCNNFGYFPLASGMLTGKYGRSGGQALGRLADNFLGLGAAFMTDRNFEVVEKLEAFCKERDRTLLELAISCLAQQRFVSSAICGAPPEQVEQNVAASNWTLTPEELAAVDQLTQA